MENIVTANELKTKGISRIDEITLNGDEAIISVRGKRRYVVLTVEQYSYLRECELEAALVQTRRDLENGDTVQESVEAHMQRITSA
ncbi:MAG: prevent-host-death protein [Spirochaetaceae bacterium]|nr:MAG: prevent-host-death protein [Spirochaetaceae bacterium]